MAMVVPLVVLRAQAPSRAASACVEKRSRTGVRRASQARDVAAQQVHVPSDAREVEAGLLTGAVDLERAPGADGVGTLDDPVLPRGEPAEDARRHVLARA